MRVNKIIIGLLIYTILPSTSIAQHGDVKTLRWTIASKLPSAPGLQNQLGLAGVFSGVSSNVLLIAGGSYFPEKMPWEGGKKAHTDQIFVLKKDGYNKFTWLTSANARLKNKTAYGASTTINNGVVCVGGETETATSNSDAFLMYWDATYKKVVFHGLPSLPIPVANACITSIGKKIYLMGGESNGIPSAKVFLLDLAVRQPQWVPLADLPLAMSHSVAVTQSNGEYPCVYVIGGRSATPSGISELHNNTYCYDPIKKEWTALSNISDGIDTTNLSAATGVAIGKHQILIVSGDKGNIFHEIETYNYKISKATDNIEKECLKSEKIALITKHDGFSRDVLLYNTLSNTWSKIDLLLGYGHVTSIAVKWGNDVFIPGGEIKPGIRTPDILRGEILNELK